MQTDKTQPDYVDQPGFQLRRHRPERDVRKHGDLENHGGHRRHRDDTPALGNRCAYLDPDPRLGVNPRSFTDAFDAYQNMTGATMDSNTGLLTVTEDQFGALESMFFNIGGVSWHIRCIILSSAHVISKKMYELTPDAQLWPRSVSLSGPPLILADGGCPAQHLHWG